MNARQVQRAARIYSLAMVATMDHGGVETEDEGRVVEVAIESAQAKLSAMGLSISDVNSLPSCLRAALSQGGGA